ncbi:(2Fe-2S)-binding protein [Paremcibacter congregatus]|uniref:(2Fe-2S)-binding protein n=1 Tax=Paremcibacter congregatus TaxID=2043170 RepID=A0A2G4YQZ3_9PROT|nr:(2Fe-2S)-binding protein [Paremcibacter congregatus]PHZ84754.1 (2Fe-2S)-binding protein [Paremcibacter congregatus]QDE28946.1 (2Fe-2S)-binding protein [Paremcibacter congregatus]
MIALFINGKSHALALDPSTPLLWVLRDELGLVGTKFGCGKAQCGACTVHVDGQAVRSCQTFLEDIDGAQITTIEAVSEIPIGAAVQQAWLDVDVPQCGYCQAGQIMSATAMLSEVSVPTDADIANYMSGNICRCGTYMRIKKAIKLASKIIEADRQGRD